MSNNLPTVTIPDDCYAVILDAVQRAIIDKCASTATRKAAFSALLALVDAGVVLGGTSINSRARGASATAPTRVKTTFFTARATPPSGATTSSPGATR
jgi:hypothetical protein